MVMHQETALRCCGVIEWHCWGKTVNGMAGGRYSPSGA